jgi:hypothetical protein
VGRINFVATGGSLRNQPNTVNACSLNATSTNPLGGIPAAAAIRNAFLYWAGSGSTIDTGSGDPIAFIDGTPVSGLTYTFATDVNYSNQPGGAGPYNYTPIPDAQGFDSAVTGLQITPSGRLTGNSGAGNPSFQIRFRVHVD